MIRRMLVTLGLFVLATTAVSTVRTVDVLAAGGLQVTSTTTYTIVPEASVVRVRAEFTFVNQVPDRREGNIITRAYFTGFSTALPLSSINLAATTTNGSPLRFTPAYIPESTNYLRVEIDFPRNLFYGQRTSVVFTYDIAGFPGRDDNPTRVNSAYAAFEAYGIGDDGRVTVRVVVPPGWTVDSFGTDVQQTEEFGYTVFTATDIPSPDEFSLFIAARNDANLTSTIVTSPSGATFDIRAWPGDDEWVEFMSKEITEGLPALEALIGQPWPIDDTVEVREVYTLYFYGYAGVFITSTNEIEVGEDLDSEVALHELSHAWFSDDWFKQRWISEGFAQVYSNQVLRERGDDALEVRTPAKFEEGRVQLNDWDDAFFDDSGEDDPTEAYGYKASYYVGQQLVDACGFDGMKDVFAAVASDDIAYVGDVEPEQEFGDTNWQRLLDLMDERCVDPDVDQLLIDYVLTDSEADLLDDRTASRDDYADLLERGGEWAVPEGIRTAMASWDFERADEQMAEAQAVLDRRDELDKLAADLGVGYIDDLETIYEGTVDDYDEINAALDEQIAAAEALLAAIDAEAQDDGFIEGIGLIGTDLPTTLEDAKVAFADGDLAAVRDKTGEVVATIDEADDLGTSRVVRTVAAVVGGLLLIIGSLLLIRRRRRRKRVAAAVVTDELPSTEMLHPGDTIDDAEVDTVTEVQAALDVDVDVTPPTPDQPR